MRRFDKGFAEKNKHEINCKFVLICKKNLPCGRFFILIVFSFVRILLALR